ncbi:MAG: radical SAM protein [Chloroflexi bacterium]|nr:MAG: radical SAM protein [Chloroflexota bacterium]
MVSKTESGESKLEALSGAVDRLLGEVDSGVAHVLDRALAGEDISVEEGTSLLEAQGWANVNAIVLAADDLRRRTVGDVVTYIINRNINFTNVCIKHCTFCAFSRSHREEEAYYLPVEEIVRRAREAWELGATEVCIQAGLPPKMKGDYYLELTRVPGTSAEVLDQEVRDLISPGRITKDQWVEVVTTAHELGIRTTSTIMYGHVESARHVAAHLGLLRDIQKQTGGFTEFVPLGFVHTEAPMYGKSLVENVRPGATGAEVLKTYAVSRLMLNNWIPNLQVSWVKEGPKLSQILLNAGGNDFMGTLMNESISTSAGATYGQCMKPREMRRLIRDAGRIPAERTTTYGIRREFGPEEDDHYDPLDLIEGEAEEKFGSYARLTHSPDYKFRDRYEIPLTPVSKG